METIHKYPIRCTGYAEPQRVEMPRDAYLLNVSSQPVAGAECEKLFLWAKVETENVTEERNIIVCGTGQPFAPYEGSLVYISTFFMSADRSTGIGHAFELLTPAEMEQE